MTDQKPSEMHCYEDLGGGRKVVAIEDFYPPIDERFQIVPASRMQDGPLKSPYLGVVVVLVANQLEEYAAYIGMGSRDDSLIFVARSGTKLTFKEAQKYFSWLNPDFYRR